MTPPKTTPAVIPPHGGGGSSQFVGPGWFAYPGVTEWKDLYCKAGETFQHAFGAPAPNGTAGPFATYHEVCEYIDGKEGKTQGGSGGNGGSGSISVRTIRELTQWMADQVGHCYLYGGAPGVNFGGCPDCSSFCNYGWGKVAGQAIPGYPAGTYTGAEHGPSTLGWLAWQGEGCGSIPRDSARAGDLAVWPTHMGYVLNETQMVSAQDPANGVQISGIDGFIPGETLTILRLAVVGPGGISFPIGGLADQAQIDGLIRELAESARKMVGVTMQIRAVNPERGGI